MGKARRNPLGSPVGSEAYVVLAGSGQRTHLLNPKTRKIICNSGKNAGRKAKDGTSNRGQKPQQLRPSGASFVTCYRCQKLMQMNQKNGTRFPWGDD